MEIPKIIEQSKFFKEQGGYGVFENFPVPEFANALLDESLELYDQSVRQVKTETDPDVYKGENPARILRSVTAGPYQQQFYHDQLGLEFLCDLTGLKVSPSGGTGSYSYYIEQDAFLDFHRDVDNCQLAVITTLSDSSPGSEHGSLHVYPERCSETLADIRADSAQNKQVVHTTAGQTVVFFGGIIPHTISPIVDDRQRIVSIMCYTIS